MASLLQIKAPHPAFVCSKKGAQNIRIAADHQVSHLQHRKLCTSSIQHPESEGHGGTHRDPNIQTRFTRSQNCGAMGCFSRFRWLQREDWSLQGTHNSGILRLKSSACLSHTHARILCDKPKVALLWHFRTIEVLWSSYTQTTGLKSAPVLFAWCTERPVSVPKPSPATSSSNGPRVRLCWHKASVPRWMPIFWQFSLATLCFSWLRNIHPTKAKGNR